MIDKLTIAVERSDDMARFYAAVLGFHMIMHELHGVRLHVGTKSGFELMLVPRSVANVIARDNHLQVRFIVADVAAAVASALSSGGTVLGDIETLGGRRFALLRDPDGNVLEMAEPVARRTS